MTTRKEELKKQAQGKLAEARKLIAEAGELAKEGAFTLYFGEIGTYIPKAMFDREMYRKKALEWAQKNGKFDWNVKANIPWDDLDENERENLVERVIDDLMGEEIPYEFQEYYGPENADRWWHPSRC